jgi:hypothetical protein
VKHLLGEWHVRAKVRRVHVVNFDNKDGVAGPGTGAFGHADNHAGDSFICMPAQYEMESFLSVGYVDVE